MAARRQSHAGLQAQSPQALLTVADGFVQELDMRHGINVLDVSGRQVTTCPPASGYWCGWRDSLRERRCSAARECSSRCLPRETPPGLVSGAQWRARAT